MPQILPFDFGSLPLSTGEAAQVPCLVSSGDQPLHISWAFDGLDIAAFSGISASTVGHKASVLFIDPVKPEHRGNYTCTVRNPAGVVNFTAVLRINGMLSFYV